MGIGHGATTDSLDPATYPDQMTGTVGWGSMGNSLTEVDAKGRIIPDLAESFEPADDAKNWVFKLRKGATFHNGKTVTADRCRRLLPPPHGQGLEIGGQVAMSMPLPTSRPTATTVVFKLSGGNADFPYIASDYHIPIMPAKDDGTADWQSGIRTGPYVLEKWEPGVRATMKRNPNYYTRHAGSTRSSATVIADVAARTNALNSGEIHYMDRCDLKTLDLLKRNPDAQDQRDHRATATTSSSMDVTPAALRQCRCAERPQISPSTAKTSREGVPRASTAGQRQSDRADRQFAIDPQPMHIYDPEKAKSLLKKAGLDQLKVDLSVADAAFTGAVDAAPLFKEHAKAAGIDINVIREPNDGYWDNVWLKKPFVASYWNGRPTSDWMFTTAYAKGAAWNDTFWNNPRFNELLVQARAETDDNKRAAMYAEMQQLVHDDGGLIILVLQQLRRRQQQEAGAWRDRLQLGR